MPPRGVGSLEAWLGDVRFMYPNWEEEENGCMKEEKTEDVD